MDAEKTLEFFDAQAARAAGGLLVARSNENAQLAALNIRQLFKCHHMCGLVQWRLNREPTRQLRRAVDAVVDGVALLSEWNVSRMLEVQLPLGRAAILARLLDMSFPESSSSEHAVETRLDFLLASLPSQEGLPSTAALVSGLKDNKRTELIGNSYEVYFAIARGESSGAEALALRGESLFEQRTSNGYFRGGEQSEGGGDDGSLVVDYRLALALRFGKLTRPSIHQWRW